MVSVYDSSLRVATEETSFLEIYCSVCDFAFAHPLTDIVLIVSLQDHLGVFVALLSGAVLFYIAVNSLYVLIVIYLLYS